MCLELAGARLYLLALAATHVHTLMCEHVYRRRNVARIYLRKNVARQLSLTQRFAYALKLPQILPQMSHVWSISIRGT